MSTLKTTRKLPNEVATQLGSTKSLPPGIVFTAEQLAAMSARASALLKDKPALESHLQHRVMLHMLMLEHVVENPPPGRSATAAVLKCLRDYADLAAELMEALKGGKAQSGGGVLGDASPGHVRGRRQGKGPAR